MLGSAFKTHADFVIFYNCRIL